MVHACDVRFCEGFAGRAIQEPKATWTAKATCQAGCGRLYESSRFNGPTHARNARIKAARIAQEHSASTGHDVEVADDALTSLVACRCAVCGTETPGQASGLCGPCLRIRLERIESYP